MRQFEVRVVEISASGGLIQVHCAGPEHGSTPGQCCLALAEEAGLDEVRTPLFLSATASFFVPVTHRYARLRPDDRLDLLGPCGRGFNLPGAGGHVLVLASALERLLPTIDQALHAGLDVTVITPRSADLLPADVEIHRGPLTAELAAWADAVLLDVSDPRARARQIRALAPPRGESYVQALFVPTMPCGVGACQACWVEPTHAHARKLACVDGPVFAV